MITVSQNKIFFLSLSCLFLLAVASCSGSLRQNSDESTTQPPSARSTSLSENTLSQYQNCLSNDDCIFVNNGCCDCANGGKEAAINKRYLESFNNYFNCEGVPCSEMSREEPCGCGTVICVRNLCMYGMDGC